MSRRKLIKLLAGLGRFLLLTFFLILVLAPLYWMFVTSLKFDTEIVDVSAVTFWPRQVTFDNYVALFRQLKFGGFLKNSLILSLGTSVIVLIFSILGGYGMARFKFRGLGGVLLFFLVSQMIPGVLLTIPIYIIYSNLRMIDTKIGLLILYVVMNTPFCVITMRSFFERIPASLEEAAWVDGCTRVQGLIRIVIPVLLPGIVAVFVFAFTGAWNDLLTGVIFTSSSDNWTIPVGMKSLIGKYNVNWGQLMAGGTLALLPTIVMFAFVQKYVVGGLTAGAVKE